MKCGIVNMDARSVVKEQELGQEQEILLAFLPIVEVIV